MDGVDLKISPIEGAIRVVVIDLTFSLWVFSALNSQSGAAVRTELLTGILLIGAKAVAHLIELRGIGILRFQPVSNHHWPFKAQAHGRLEADGVICVNFERQNNGQNSQN